MTSNPAFPIPRKFANWQPVEILAAIQTALREDVGSGDATSNSIIPTKARLEAQLLAKQAGVLAGLDIFEVTCLLVDERIDFQAQVAEGAHVRDREVLARLVGPARGILTAERTALNFLGRMSGIATLTDQFVEAVAGTKAVILDTRKTAPGLRLLDKLAVLRGGGQNHRIGLYDMILIKDNHIDFAGSLAEAVQRARATRSGLQIEVETRTLEDVKAALDLNVDRILLDNMSLEMMRQAVKMNAVLPENKRTRLEASGNVTLQSVRSIAETGVDFISSGALTHSAKVFDVSLDVNIPA
ncbi:MAG: nicotinate-nucleotide diphosphorylase (carboxylating) [Chloroflexi bacterium GWB2_49_20]|nr:MAG: nicotinate-nucleotide diphosphorylase (carboxylating) [Chloroflexi bacterium GWB2_49_20]OGN78759.1 MAG: nicotinate-nucleotide diphosphorylase (carboxylating) [Chloroflexi bacterium GWC2_49_37]OGN85871.1 MAG: nicotinate-nucleotide diphosphorylase (carboxylating) [Chloroflexi bacterium GWD2_49_16]